MLSLGALTSLNKICVYLFETIAVSFHRHCQFAHDLDWFNQHIFG